MAEHREKNDLEGMKYILDEVIYFSLGQNVSEKYKNFIKAMEENDDGMLQDMARTLGMYHTRISNTNSHMYGTKQHNRCTSKSSIE